MFRRNLIHQSIRAILGSLRPYMEQPKLTFCGDRVWRKVIYGIGPYIANYPEQCLLSAVVQGWCAKYVIFMPSLY